MVVETIVLCPDLAAATTYDRRALREAVPVARAGDGLAPANAPAGTGSTSAALPAVTAVVGGLADGRPTITVVDLPAAQPGDDERTVRAHWVAYVSVQLSASSTRGPVLLVLGGRSGALAPALGFSQRAARRQVAGYVLVDADLPAADSEVGDWPDAPVAYVASPAATPAAIAHARLRGWRLVEVGDLTPTSLATALRSLLDPRP